MKFTVFRYSCIKFVDIYGQFLDKHAKFHGWLSADPLVGRQHFGKMAYFFGLAADLRRC